MKIEKKTSKTNTRLSDADASEGKLLSTGLGWTHQIRSLTTQLDLETPRTGITIKSGDISQSILGICFPQQTLKFCDGWVRGNDATGLYLTDDARQLKTVAWAAGYMVPNENIEQAIAAELILSNETLREKSDGALAVDSSLVATSAQAGRWYANSFHWEPEILGTCQYWSQGGGQNITVQCYVFQLPDTDDTVAIFTRSDEISYSVMRSEPAKKGCGSGTRKYLLKSYLFPTIIEKGVLHRGRFLAVIGPSQTKKAGAWPQRRHLHINQPFAVAEYSRLPVQFFSRFGRQGKPSEVYGVANQVTHKSL